MSLPNIPNITPQIDLDIADSLKLMLNSYAMTDIGLSHIINAEGEKIQKVLGTLQNGYNIDGCYSGLNSSCCNKDILEINNSVQATLREVLRNQMIMQMKMEDTVKFYNKILSNSNKHCDDDDDDYVTDDIKCEGVNCDPIYF